MKVIKSKAEYEAALAEIDKLLAANPAPGSDQADALEVVAVLLEEYESRTVDLGTPDPIEAIRFRMEQQGLRQRDLVPYIGSRSKVSEVLARKRPLTLSMIRALHSGLGVPSDVLLQERDPSALEESDIPWNQFPVREMVNRGWITTASVDLRDQAEDLLREFFEPLGGLAGVGALYRKTDHVRAGRKMDRFALAAWTARVLLRALETPALGKYEQGRVDTPFMQEVARLSWSEAGPSLAREYLGRHGITLIVEPHLPGTHLDGAAIVSEELQTPVIGLTIRHDRIDNFWFCLMHELAHVARHLTGSEMRFYDNLDVEAYDDDVEQEADEMASEALIPSEAWKKSAASRLRTPEAAQRLAKELGIHTAIVAGRMRHHFQSYKSLGHMLGSGAVRQCFPEVKWE